MGELSRKRDAVEEAIKKGEDTWPAWLEYAKVLDAYRADGTFACIDGCIDDLRDAGDHHGAAVAWLIYQLVIDAHMEDE